MEDTGSGILEKLWKSRNTILEILEDRGFEIPDSDKLSLEEFIDWAGEDDEKTIRNAMTLLYEKEDEEKILVYWPIEPSLGTNVKIIYKEMVEKNIKKSIIVINTKVTSQSNKFIRDIAKLNYILYIYTLAETQFNITKHRLVPQHIICTPSEKKKLLADYSINTKQLPCIKSSDVMIRHLGAKKDQIIKIIRDSETQPGYKTISYRVVS
jgi:DNA-directed RNA polymerase I, II, and III subunit RPABC1